ncbi:hypothetical protein AALP_AA8G476000 [Arabis alpina]|uniref:carbonic anhydrase n=1 Tax=Arabis alpina TaxID=50452 RepID=A0A087GE25_ARAAL|nr:hypothetical protein AALP_AA8G476000 [Arabis alpina]
MIDHICFYALRLLFGSVSVHSLEKFCLLCFLNRFTKSNKDCVYCLLHLIRSLCNRRCFVSLQNQEDTEYIHYTTRNSQQSKETWGSPSLLEKMRSIMLLDPTAMAIVSSITSTSVDLSSSRICVTPKTPKIFTNNSESKRTYLRFCTSSRRYGKLRFAASMVPLKHTREEKHQNHVTPPNQGHDIFEEIKHRFLSFKKAKYMENLERFQSLAKSQSPKFMVIACADSRVCPSEILGFQSGEAFTVRNIANIVPSYESGPSETKAALEFAVNSLQVENILVVGHSRCGGIRALMTMDDDETEQDIDSRNFIKNWVVIGKTARSISKTVASELSFEQQCQHCEKESVNCSLRNLLTYPWIVDRVKNGTLSIHGGHYDFTECTFEKWTVDYKKRSYVEGKITVKDRSIWK